MLSNQSPAPTAPPNEPLQTSVQTSVQAPLQSGPTVSVAERAAQITYLVLGVVEALLIGRVILKLLAANPSSGIVRFVYNVTAPLVAPFQGIFPTPATANSVLELSSLVAIAAYALIGWGIVRLIAIFGPRLSNGTAS